MIEHRAQGRATWGVWGGGGVTPLKKSKKGGTSLPPSPTQSKDDYYTIYSYAHAAVSSASRKVGRGVWGGGEPANRRNTMFYGKNKLKLLWKFCIDL